ncbi:MAG: hypothetical protein R3D89_01210 [Sphingomonadaceae bacterium]
MTGNGSLRERLTEAWEAFREFEEDLVWEDWIEKFHENIVPITIVAIPILMLTTCAVSLTSAGFKYALADEKAVKAEKAQREGSKRNPWSLDEPTRR